MCCLGMVLSLMAGWALAHPGGLDRHGCHHDRKRGGYHCHGGERRQPADGVSASALQSGTGAARLQPGASTQTTSGGAYRNCDEARAAGAAPIKRGEPGYGPHLDRDNDGIACEPWRGR